MHLLMNIQLGPLLGQCLGQFGVNSDSWDSYADDQPHFAEENAAFEAVVSISLAGEFADDQLADPISADDQLAEEIAAEDCVCAGDLT